MPEKKTDRRTQRTRQMLRRAFLELIVEKGYDPVNIQEITDRADLGRATFYLHYKDKEELLVEISEMLVEEFIRRIEQIPVEQWALSEGAPILQVFEYAREQAGLYRAIMSGQGGLSVSKRLHTLIAANTQAVMEAQIAEKGLSPRLPLDFLSNYFAGSLLALVYWWLENGMPYPAEEMTRLFRQISLYGRVFALGMD